MSASKQNWSTLAAVRAFLTFTSVRELGLSNCRLHLPGTKLESVPPQTYECQSIVVLKLAGAQVCTFFFLQDVFHYVLFFIIIISIARFC